MDTIEESPSSLSIRLGDVASTPGSTFNASEHDERYHSTEQKRRKGRTGSDPVIPPGPVKTRVRDRYVTRACLDCKRRKVKCSGEDTCVHCRARNATCVYIAKRSRPEKERKTNAKHRPPKLSSSTLAQQSPTIEGIFHNEERLSLLERVRVLEEKVESLQQYGPEMWNMHSGSQNLNTPDSSDLSDGRPSSDQSSPETDTFDPNSSEPIGLSLSSQLRCLRELWGSHSRIATSHGALQSKSSLVKIDLPKPTQLHHLLDVCFRDYSCYFPYMNEHTSRRNIFTSLEALGYGESRCTLFVGDKHSSSLALLCTMLAIAEIFDPPRTSKQHFRPGWWIYLQGIQIIHHFGATHMSLDLVLYHTTAASYLILAEYLSGATQAITKAYQLASKLKLNEQRTWISCSREEQLDRKRLWWIIYFIDRRISQKNGTAYIIRDNEMAVDDFVEKPLSHIWSESGNTPRTDDGNYDLSVDDAISYKYLQVLVNLGRIWGQIWDTFFAVKTRNPGDPQEVEIMDTRIVFLQRKVPLELDWDSETVLHNVEQGEPETQTRRRLGIYVRINLLRMIIRQNPLHDWVNDSEAKKFCAELAMKTVEAISTFTKLFPSSYPSAYFNTASLVECIYHLVPFLRDSTKIEGRKAAARSFYEARNLLSDLAKLIEGAKRALSIIESIVIEDEDGNTSGSYPMENEVQHGTYDVFCPTLPSSAEFLGQHLHLDTLNMWSRMQLDEHSNLRGALSGGNTASPFPITDFNLPNNTVFAMEQGVNLGDPNYNIPLGANTFMTNLR
ncbi:hypothetical protein F5884DRAFT_798384 [Xylogone sp. PMI_703]|nr:hypothetical protein F5884DRAFT_798384 [Xylogone sp. PMI_703]